MILHARSTPALAVAAAAGLIFCSGFQRSPSVAAEPPGAVAQATHEAPRSRGQTLLQSSRKAAARTGEAIVGVTKTAGRFVGWMVVKTITSFFDDDDTSDPVRAHRDQELNSWIESRDKWLREERSR